jgi:subtilisin family serine protease
MRRHARSWLLLLAVVLLAPLSIPDRHGHGPSGTARSSAINAAPIALSNAATSASTAVPSAQVVSAAELIGADRWRAAGFTGIGVRVAVVDTGFAGYEQHLGQSLPAQVHARSFRADGDLQANSDHGTLAARIVTSIAPAAELHLLNFGTLGELAALAEYVIAQRIQVVSFSIGFVHNGPGNGTGSVNDIITRGASGGALWAVAAGNWAQQHWAGTFTDRNGNSIHEFAQGVEEDGRTYRAGDLIIVSLRWDDPWGQSCNDYDLELFGPDDSLVRASRGAQNCRSDPVEGIQVLATRDGRYRARIVRAGAAPRRLELLMLGSPDRSEALEIPVLSGSLAEPADNASVLTVGATNPLSPQQLARFSSRGPTTDGRPKPDIVSPTGPATGAEAAFGGTSAATPHAAGAAALLLEAFPQANARELMSQIQQRATRLPAPAVEAEAGAGALQLGTLSNVGAILPLGAETATLTDVSPPNAPITVFRYRGPRAYPARFTHLLTGGRVPLAVHRFDLVRLRFDTFVSKAPTIVNTYETFSDGDLLFVTFAQ